MESAKATPGKGKRKSPKQKKNSPAQAEATKCEESRQAGGESAAVSKEVIKTPASSSPLPANIIPQATSTPMPVADEKSKVRDAKPPEKSSAVTVTGEQPEIGKSQKQPGNKQKQSTTDKSVASGTPAPSKKKPQNEPGTGKPKNQQAQNPSKTPKKGQDGQATAGAGKQNKAAVAAKKASKSQQQKKAEVDQKEDIFQAVLLADNFGCSIFGTESPLTQEGLVPLANRKLIDYSLESLTVSGVQEIFLYCSSEADAIRRHIKESKWSSLPDCTIHIVASEDALSLGDALRDFDAKGMLRNDFILMTAGVITNLPLKSLLNIHRESVKNDKGAVMTLVCRKMLPGHRSRPKTQNRALVVNSSTKKLIAFDDKLSGKKLNIPLDRIGNEMDVYLDCVDSGIAVCSALVPPLFTDNFDFTSLSDFLRGILINEEILGNSIYLHRVENGYANRVVDFDTFHGISCDVMQRWTYPVVPDLPFGSNPQESNYSVRHDFIYKGDNVKISNGAEIGKSVILGAKTEIGKGVKITYSVLGDHCKVSTNVELIECHIGSNVVIKDNTKLTRCIISSGAILECNTDMNDILFVSGEKYEISLPTERGMGVDSSGEADSSEDDFDTDGSGGFEDDDFKIFSTEVTQSLVRGYKENVAIENLVLEINSSKYAYNMTFKEVTTGVCSGILSLASKMNAEFTEKFTTKIQWDKIKDVITKLLGLLVHYVKTNESQMDLLESLEEFASDNLYFRPMLVQTIHLLYDEEILSEESILKWHKTPSLYDGSVELRGLVKKLVDWLETADSDSEEE